MSGGDQENVPIPDEELTEYTVKSSYSQYTKILLIDKNVEQYQKFVNGANSSTFTIVYKHTSKHKHLEEFLLANLKHVTRLAIVSHGLPGEEHHYYHNMSFMESEHFFKMSDLASGITEYSPNVAFLKTLLTKMSINRLDFLACNLLRYTEWTQYLDLLKSFKSGLLVGASNDQTGNLQYGGNWTMENTLENIKTVYFSSTIENYTGLLNYSYIAIDDNGTSRIWGYNENGRRIWTCSDHTGIVNVPFFSSADGYTDTYFLMEVFQNSSTLSNVIIPDGIRQYERSFKGCSSTLTAQIGYNCSHMTEAFRESGITSVELGLPYNVMTEVPVVGFIFCTQLTSVSLGTSITKMNGGCLGGCPLLTHLTIPSACTFVAGIGSSGLTDITFTEPVNVREIYGLSGNPITGITIPSTVTLLRFVDDMPLTSLTVPSSVRDFAGIRNCTSLTHLEIPDTCTFYFHSSFYIFQNLNSLTSITLPSTLTSNWSSQLFTGTFGFSSVTIPYGCTQMPNNAFVSESITQLVVPSTLTSANYSFTNVDTINKISSIRVYTSSDDFYNYIGNLPLGTSLHGPPGNNNYDSIMATFNPSDTTNWSLVVNSITLPDPIGNVLEITTISLQDLTDENIVGTTTISKRSFTRNLIKDIFSQNANAISGKKVTLKNVTLPGFSTVEEVVVFNSSTSEGTNFTNTISKSDITGKNFYILMENANDEVTLPSKNGNVTVTKTNDTTFSINNGITITTKYSGDSYTFDGLTINLGSVFGYLADSNTICFKEGTKIACLDENSNPTEIPVEELRSGMFVKTYKHGYIPVHTIGTKKLYNPENDTREKDRLYECTPEQYPDLTENLYITGCHSILVDQLNEQQTTDTLREAQDIFITDDKYRLMAFLDERTKPWSKEGTHVIYHIYLDHPDEFMNYGIYANGLLVESCSKWSMKEKSYMTLSTIDE